MSRQDGAVLHHVDTSFWEYVEKMDDDRMVCKFCGHGFAKDTAITRIKLHLAEVTGRGVKIYGKVPQDVQEAALAAVPIDGPTTWWFEDLLVLNVLSFDKVIRMMMSQKLDHATIFRFIVFRLKSGYISVTASEKCKITEVAINLLSLLDRSSLSCRGLFDILQAVSRLKNISKFYALKLEHLVGSMLDQATLDHLLVPSPHKNHHVYDVNLVLRLLKVFILEGSTMSRNQLRKVASLTDSYLIEVAPDIRLKPSKFAALIMVLPDPARESSDRLYQAIDMYLQVHVQLCEEVKMRLCSFVNHDKLSAEAFKHLKTRAGPSNNEVTNAAQQQNNEMEPLERGSFHERPSFNQADEPRGDPSQPTNDQFCSPSVNNDVSVNEATERLVQHEVVASSFGVYGNQNAISTTPQEQNNVAGDAGTTPAAETMGRAPGRSLEKHIRSLEACLMGDGTDNGTGGGVQPGAGASSFGGLAGNTNETPGDQLPTSSTKLVGQAFEQNANEIWSWLMDNEVSTIGIYGMGGVGKTTMLKHIYNELLQRPDISHHVYWVTVSINFSIKRLQTIIAECIGLHFSSVDDDLRRAAKLSKELRKKQRWILVLDDLWKSFELHKVGIPVPLKGCKLLITTRSEKICRQMTSKNNVRVNPLSNEEAWTLFMEVLGHEIPLSPQVEQVARDITRECAGLPLGIKTIAGTMKGVDGMHEWSDALEDLKQSKLPQDRVEEEVFRILRFSYTHLRDSALQQCFLYCGLYPEDFEIRRENLIDYLIDEGVVKRQKSREAEINKGHTMLDRLERACLLERLRGGDYVKMHDLTRDMAIQILEENSRAIVKAGAQLKELPDAEEWSEKLKRVSLMHNQIEEICSRHSPRCPNMSTLLLCKNGRLRFIVDSFFEQLHGLKVLDLSKTNIECLPDSVSDLEGLTSLLLRDCRRLSSVPSLKKLRALTRLDLSTSPLKKIPHGMKYLLNLRYLRMNGCGENKFPGGILPKLSRLQVFILEEWIIDDFTMDKEIYAPVTVEGKEVGCLRKLESLECHFEDQSNYLEFLKSRDATQSLRTYRIVVGQLREDYNEQLWYRHSGTKLVVLGNLNINRDRDFLVIFSNDIQGLICKSIDAGSIGDVFPLKYRLNSCTSMESLVSSSWVCSAPLPQPSPSYNGIFSALKLLSCYGCKSMKKLFPSVLLPNLVNLQEIEVGDCEKMEEIIGGTSSDEEGAMGEESNEFKLPKLRSLRLQGLPELKSICSAKLICDSLREIKVSKCNSMEIMVPSSWSGLTNLEEISVEDCDKMEEIIGGTRSDEEGAMGEESNEFKLPKLRRLNLSNLPELKSICNAKLICNSLERIVLCRCNSIEILVPSSWSCLLNLEEITVAKCEKMEEIIGGTRSDERVMGKESISSEFKLPKLRRLNFVELPELKSICNAKLICDSLNIITVCHCEKLKRIPIFLQLLENGQPSPPPSLNVITIYPEEWWESIVEWEHPNAKNVLRRFVELEASTSKVHMLKRRLHEQQLELELSSFLKKKKKK